MLGTFVFAILFFSLLILLNLFFCQFVVTNLTLLLYIIVCVITLSLLHLLHVVCLLKIIVIIIIINTYQFTVLCLNKKHFLYRSIIVYTRAGSCSYWSMICKTNTWCSVWFIMGLISYIRLTGLIQA